MLAIGFKHFYNESRNCIENNADKNAILWAVGEWWAIPPLNNMGTLKKNPC